MTSIAILTETLKILKLNRNNFCLATEIEKQKKITFFDTATLLEQAIFRIFRAP